MPIIVKRPEPVDEDAPKPAAKRGPGGPRGQAKLSPEEIRALLAVEGANRPTKSKTLWRRGRVVVVPTGLISIAAHLLIGSWAPLVTIAAILLAVAWVARPLLKKDGWD